MVNEIGWGFATINRWGWNKSTLYSDKFFHKDDLEDYYKAV